MVMNILCFSVSIFLTTFFYIGINSFRTKALVVSQNLSVKKDTDLCRFMLSMVGCILEQGSHHCSSNKQTRAILCVTIAAVIASLIISNAYKGFNINKMNSPFKQIVYDSLEDILKHKFNIFSSVTRRMTKRHIVNNTKECLREFTVATEAQRAWKKSISTTKEDVIRARNLRELVNIQIPRYGVGLLCLGTVNLNGAKIRSCSWFETDEKGRLQGFLEDICLCNQTAFIEDEWFLRNYLEPAVKQNAKAGSIVHVGKSNLLDILHGIVIQNMIVSDLNERIDILAASGIVGRMNSLQASLRLIMAMNTLHYVSQPRRKSFDGLNMYSLWKVDDRNNNEVERRHYQKWFTDKLNSIRKGLSKQDINLQPEPLSVNGNTVTLFIVIVSLQLISIMVMCWENSRNICMRLWHLCERISKICAFCLQSILTLHLFTIVNDVVLFFGKALVKSVKSKMSN